jgi:hypothetical protein
MNYNPRNTLSCYDSMPQVKLFDMGGIPIRQFAINCKNSLESTVPVLPDAEAIEFYALNHLAAIVRKNFTKHEPLPDWAFKVMAAYQVVLRNQGHRLLNYMALITTREARHAKKNATFTKGIAKYKADFYDYLQSVSDSSSSIGSAFIKAPEEMTMNSFFSALEYTFRVAGFGNQFGGKPWALIADTLVQFIIGNTSLEMMVDTAYTLAHNNGPMFNKGMMYQHYTGEIYKVLDVQRSGQIPELVMHDKTLDFVQPYLLQLVLDVAAIYPAEFGPEVDWYKVEALGSLKQYPKEKKNMKNQPPAPPTQEELEMKAGILGSFYVYPGQKVFVVTREFEAA